MALGRGTFENSFSSINSYNVGRKAQELSPSGVSSRNQPIGSVFSSNIGSSSKMGFFGNKKDDVDSNDADFFYGKNFLPGRNTLNDNNSLASQMSNLNIYGFNKTKDLDRSSSPSWSTGGGWSQMGSGLPQGLGTSGLTNNMLPSASRQQSSMSNSNLLQFSRSLSAQSFSNIGSGSPSGSQSSSDLTNSFQNNLKLMSGQSSPRGGLLSISQAQQHNLSNTSQQQHRGVIGQLPSMSMQQHSSPSHSPGLSISSKLITSQPSSTSRTLPPSSLPPSSANPSSVANNSSGLQGFGTGLPMRSSNFGQSLLSSVIPSSQNSMLNSDASLSSTLNNVSGLPNPPPQQNHLGQQNNSTSFDSDFPALANRAGSSSNSRPGQNSFSFAIASGNKGMEGNQEFQIQNEDFPALPGATQQQLPSDTTSLPTSAHLGTTTQPSLPNHLGQHMENKDPLGENYGVGSYEQILKDGRLTIEKKQKSGAVSGIQTNASGVITNIPSGMVTDQFGMIGLLTFIRAAETEPNLVTLALGSDLTTLGLNLNSTESLYHTFGSPFSDSTCKPHEIDFYAPQEYLISSYIRDKLAPIKLGRYGEDLLFYLYYTNCGDILQLAAAAELYARDWRYHKDERVWITRFPGMEPQIKTNTYERGTYYYFDPQGWRKVAKEFYVEYERLEEKPTAQALQQQQQQQQLA